MATNPKPILHIDGAEFTSLDEFYVHVSVRLIPNVDWGRNLDAFNDILRGGFGTPEDGFVLCWHSHEISKRKLGYRETVRQLQRRAERCHPSNRIAVEAQLAAALEGKGPTVFD